MLLGYHFNMDDSCNSYVADLGRDVSTTARIFSILNRIFYIINTNGLHLGVLGFLLVVPPPMVLVASVEGPQGVALVHR